MLREALKRLCIAQLGGHDLILARRCAVETARPVQAADSQACPIMRPFPLGFRAAIHTDVCKIRPANALLTSIHSGGVVRSGARRFSTICFTSGAKGSSSRGRRATVNGRDASQNAKERSNLTQLPGVGARNEERLVSKGIRTVETLTEIYRERFDHDSCRLVEYLQKEIGIKRRYCVSIATYFEGQYTQQTPQPFPAQSDRVTLSVEGNISSGKSTFLNWIMEEPLMLRDLCEVVPEPVDMWQSVGGNPDNNLLERFYENPQKYAYEFQNYVFLTRLRQNHRSWEGTKSLRLLERSVFSDRLVFVRAVHEAKWLDDMQLELYDSWFNPMLKEAPGLVPDGFIYLRAEPSTCMRRLKKRARTEEVGVDEGYLEGLHQKHEDWFSRTTKETEQKLKTGRPSQLLLDDLPASSASGPLEVPHILQDSVIWLGGSGILSHTHTGDVMPQEVKAAMARVPALVLDCDHDIDIQGDVDAKMEYAEKVRAYSSYVKAYRERSRQFWMDSEAEERRAKWDIVDKLPLNVLQNIAMQGSAVEMFRGLSSNGVDLSSLTGVQDLGRSRVGLGL